MYINNLITGSLTLGSGGSTPSGHEETWYKYTGDTEWRTAMLGRTIALFDDEETPSGQIENPNDIVAIEIGTGTQANPLTSIGYYAFAYCIGLTSVTIPSSVTSIGSDAFGFCSELTSVTFEGKDRATVQGMTNYPFGLNVANMGGVTIQCTDGDIQVQFG